MALVVPLVLHRVADRGAEIAPVAAVLLEPRRVEIPEPNAPGLRQILLERLVAHGKPARSATDIRFLTSQRQLGRRETRNFKVS